MIEIGFHMEELKNLLDELRTLPSETEWVEFKTARLSLYPNLFVSAQIAAITGEKSSYIKNLFDKKHYKKMIIDFLSKYNKASRQDINDLLISKLPDILNENQKRKKINNLLHEMSKKDMTIKNTGTRKNPRWVSV